ncbi:MAG TPA: anion transporter [Longimicrobiaceae bacterium]|nr:anion transporter [Longimicrobiaceae bacterium]
MTTVRLAILVVTYLLIATNGVPRLRLRRPVTAALGALAMVLAGGLPVREAARAVDVNVLAFLLGVMVMAAYLETGGFFERVAGWLMLRFPQPHRLLAAVVAASGVLSAFFMNDTLCLVLPPLVIATVRPLGIRPAPYLLAVALAANVGSAMAISGNPQNMLIGISSGIAFGRFLWMLLPASIGGLVLVYAVLRVLYRRELALPAQAPRPAPELPFDGPLVARVLAVFAVALGGWLLGYDLPAVAMAGGVAAAVVAWRSPLPALRRVEWPLLLFFAALFVLMEGVRATPAVTSISAAALRHTGSGPWADAWVVSGAMVLLSNLVSNVPAVILWLPVVPRLPRPDWIWLVMAMSSTFAGNLTLLGSMANLIVAERAQSRGVALGFGEYLRAGLPVTVLTLAWGVATLVWMR